MSTRKPITILGPGLGALALVLVLALGGLVIALWPRAGREEASLAVFTRAELELRDGVLYRPGAETPFDGTLMDYFPGEVKRASIEIHEGRAHGVTRGWFEDGQLEVEEHFVEGVSHGLRTRWYPGGQRKSETQIVDGVPTGKFLQWHENGQKAVEMTMVGGKADGLCQAWHQSGRLKSRATVKNGEVVEREFFADDRRPSTAHNGIAQP